LDKWCRAEEDLKLTGEIDVEPGNINFPLGGLLLQMLQFKSGPGGISFWGVKEPLDFFKLAIPLLLFVQELSNPALQLLHLSFVGGIPFIQLLGHVH
jgi:hypothetical protein